MSDTPWTPEQINEIQTLYAQGVSSKIIAARVGRSKGSVLSRLARSRRSEDDTAKAAEYKRQWNRAQRTGMRCCAYEKAPKVDVPPDVLVRRNAYINAEAQGLTGAQFGDPRRGYSALDRRGA